MLLLLLICVASNLCGAWQVLSKGIYNEIEKCLQVLQGAVLETRSDTQTQVQKSWVEWTLGGMMKTKICAAAQNLSLFIMDSKGGKVSEIGGGSL